MARCGGNLKVIARANAAAFFSTGSPLYFPPTNDERACASARIAPFRVRNNIASRRAATSGGLLSAADVASARGAVAQFPRRGINSRGRPSSPERQIYDGGKRRVSPSSEKKPLRFPTHARRREKRTLPRSRARFPHSVISCCARAREGGLSLLESRVAQRLTSGLTRVFQVNASFSCVIERRARIRKVDL